VVSFSNNKEITIMGTSRASRGEQRKAATRQRGRSEAKPTPTQPKPNNYAWTGIPAISLLALIAIVVLGCVAFLSWSPNSERDRAGLGTNPVGPTPEESRADWESVLPHGLIPVALNRGPEVLDGFRGDVHPLLHGPTRLEVTADWTPIGKGRDHLERTLNPLVYSWFTELQPAQPRQTYTAKDFSAFLPVTVGDVGQLWALDADKVAKFLRQFHPCPSMHLVALGRRAGPDGAFGILRAVSPSYLDIVFRIHAEFYLTPQSGPPVPIDAWYTPAYFSGRVLVNKETGTVDYFRLGLATDKALNVHLTVDARRMGYGGNAHDIVRVERMELTGGDSGLTESLRWEGALTSAEAGRRLAKVFYKAQEINWVPFDQVFAKARRQNRPIFAIVSWGATDDQSC
jgi:hypothetical protein